MALQEEFEQQGVWLFRYRSYLPLIILPIGLWLYVSKATTPLLSYFDDGKRSSAYLLFCILVSIFGLIIRIVTVGHTPSNTSGRNTKEQIADTINQSGIYSIVRHPLYLGNFFMWLGIALITLNFWFIMAFCLLYWVYYERIMFAEEQFLRRKFKEPYLQWAAKTPAFIPNWKHYQKASLKMSWKKVLKKEKNGFCAIFVLFALFDVTAYLYGTTPQLNIPLLIATAVSLLIYLILKVLKRKTNLLNESGR
ncbi:MAG: isoprenylcysteine carboxylmethyltransferase family protein [Bacteroidales bacterium]|jgi:protein-S-isoprenylcysteine O-methyltransferase Ste14|nr:isoprenylcysteine carboxylmethyltransferase family protein [Bacteroidales bacterium]